MGVISNLDGSADAQERPAEDGGDSGEGRDPDRHDPFLQEYLTDRWEADDQTVDQILTGLIAVGNLFS